MSTHSEFKPDFDTKGSSAECSFTNQGGKLRCVFREPKTGERAVLTLSKQQTDLLSKKLNRQSILNTEVNQTNFPVDLPHTVRVSQVAKGRQLDMFDKENEMSFWVDPISNNISIETENRFEIITKQQGLALITFLQQQLIR